VVFGFVFDRVDVREVWDEWVLDDVAVGFTGVVFLGFVGFFYFMGVV